MDPYEQWQFLESLLPLSRECQIAEWGMMVLNNPMLRGSPKIRCCLPGVYARRKRGAGSFHGKYLQDCVFVIDPQTAEADSVNFDYNEPRQRDTVVYGRIYLIFEIRVRYYEKLRRRHRRSVEHKDKPRYEERHQDEICILLKQFDRVQATFTQSGMPQVPFSYMITKLS